MRVFIQTQNRPRQRVLSELKKSSTAAPAAGYPADPILHLQRTIGNQAVQRMLALAEPDDLQACSSIKEVTSGACDFNQIPAHAKSSASIQAKLAVSSPGDKYEQEAERVAERVMNTSPSELHTCARGAECPQCRTRQPSREHQDVHSRRVAVNDLGQTSIPPIVHEVLRSPGESLDLTTRARMEPRFGHDFSKVRVHTNDRAAGSAQAVNALAYTVGENVVFAAGQYAPSSPPGQKLIAHELAHVVQQNGSRHSHEGLSAQHGLSLAPSGVIARRLPPDWQEEPPDWYLAKRAAIQKHGEEQRTVIDFLEKGRNIKPDPTKGFSDPDNLFRNTVQMFDAGRFRLSILSPTHYSDKLHFDPRVKHPAIGGDYPVTPPADPKVPGPGLMYETSALGKLEPAPTPPQIQTLPAKVERAPGEAPKPEKTEPTTAKPSTPPPPAFSAFLPGDVFVFTHGMLTEGQFRQTFVHEGQHVADLTPQRVTTNDVERKLEAYKSEFRAFWIQPVLPRTSLAAPGGERFSEPTGKADNTKKVTITDPQKKCTLCPPGNPSGKAFAEPKTGIKNARQEGIFWHIITNYAEHQYDCCYVYNEQFHKEVNQFAYPESINLINSERLMSLDLELQNLTKSMTQSQVSSTNLVALLAKLEPIDWAFINDPILAKTFWDTLRAAAPEFVYKGVKVLLTKGAKGSVSEAEVNRALSGK